MRPFMIHGIHGRLRHHPTAYHTVEFYVPPLFPPKTCVEFYVPPLFPPKTCVEFYVPLVCPSKNASNLEFNVPPPAIPTTPFFTMLEIILIARSWLLLGVAVAIGLA